MDKPVNPQDEYDFTQLLGSESPEKNQLEPLIDQKIALAGLSGYPDTGGNSTQIDIDSYKAEPPEIPQLSESPADFWIALEKAGKTLLDFLGSAELAQFVQAANTVFAGAMVVSAGVLLATGVGAPVAVAALALAGGAGLAMQLPAVQAKLEAGVLALMTPVLGEKIAAQLGPLVTQGLISGLMIALLATGGSTGSAQGALDAAMGVFDTMQGIFNGLAQAYQNAAPLMEMLGINLDAKALQQMSGLFGTMGAMMPDFLKFADGLGRSLNHFLANPSPDALANFLGTLTDLPKGLAQFLDSNLFKGLGALLEASEQFLTELKDNDVITNIAGLLQILSQVANLAKA